ncbi:pirin family protein [Celerinatantimonas yamalensis]|uniref:Pirin family protein n=1 Tax=Celerinatantimonas yamalensis TaxID=559956 RepID=A0ABW9G8H1_9GAMM
MLEKRPSTQRGQVDMGWLNSHHSFSFGSYYDPAQMGHSVLRVINDDRVIPAAGFDTHGHRDMEIISYVLSGTMVHRDSEGNEQRLPAGEFQLMSAGAGIYHSEFNASERELLHFLQIWIEPNVQGQRPGYQQKDFGLNPGLTLIASPSGEQGTLQIKQDAKLAQLILAPGQSLSYPLGVDRHGYVHHIEGDLTVNEQQLAPGDGVKITETAVLSFSNHSQQSARALLFDLP